MLADNEKKALLKYARAVITHRLTGQAYESPTADTFTKEVGVFVTLHKKGSLRGCIGYPIAYKSILDSVKEMSLAAAFNDPRFSPLKQNELLDIELEISILSPMSIVEDTEEIIIGRDGLFLKHPYGSGLLLPQVAEEENWDVPTFLKHICYKASLPFGSHLDEGAKLFKFSAEVFSESQF